MKRADALAVRRGAVVRTTGSECWVELDNERCPQCTGACGVAIGGSAAVRVEYAGGPAPKPGTPVWFSVARRRFTGAVALTFGAPLLGLIGGAALAAAMHGTQATAPTAGWMLAGLVIGGVVPFWTHRIGAGWRRGPMLELEMSFGEPSDRSRAAQSDTEGSNR